MTKKHKHSFREIARTIIFIIGVNLTLILCWTGAYFLLPFIYDWIGREPHGYLRQIINSVLGFLFFGLIMMTIGLLFAPRQRNGMKIMIDAMKRMATGDFSVQLPANVSRNNPFGEIVDNFNQMAVQLNQLEQMRQEFISNVSHEIQSPLTSISGFARVLQNDRLTQEERLHYLTIIEAESMRLAKLSDNLLKLTSLESKDYPLKPKKYRLDKQLRTVILACEPQWLDKAIEMDILLDEVTVEADEDLLSQVWTNLIHNSIKFTPNGGIIGVHLHRDGRQAKVLISDSGIGILAEDQAYIFDRFYKADKSRNRAPGSGLGLAIAKKILDMHQGTIEVESEPGKGTTMKVGLVDQS